MANLLEPSKSARSRCRLCREEIEQGELRFGLDREGWFADGAEAYAWYHVKCATRAVPKELGETLAKVKRRSDVDDYDALVEACTRNAQKRDAKYPYAERAPSGRAKCMKCEVAIGKGDLRVVVEREIVTPAMTTTGAGFLHPACAIAYTGDPDLATAVGTNAGGLLSAADRREIVTALDAARDEWEGAPMEPAKKEAAKPSVPRDATPLVLADSLSEAGDPRGELIVVEDRLSSPELSLSERASLEVRRASLMPDVLARWQAAIDAPKKAIELSRGLPQITIGDGIKLDVAKVLTDTWVRALVLRRASDKQIAAVLTSPAMARIEALAFEHVQKAPELVEGLATSTSMGALRRLSLAYMPINARCLFQLLGSRRLTALEELVIVGPWWAGQATSLARAAGLPSLRHLSFETGLAREGVAALARSPLGRRLASMRVGGWQVVDGLTEAPLPNLVALSVASGFMDGDAEKLAKALPALRTLTISPSPMSDEGAAPFGDPSLFPALERLDVRGNALGEATIARLRARFGDGLLVDAPAAPKRSPAKKGGTKKSGTKKSVTKRRRA